MLTTTQLCPTIPTKVLYNFFLTSFTYFTSILQNPTNSYKIQQTPTKSNKQQQIEEACQTTYIKNYKFLFQLKATRFYKILHLLELVGYKKSHSYTVDGSEVKLSVKSSSNVQASCMSCLSPFLSARKLWNRYKPGDGGKF